MDGLCLTIYSYTLHVIGMNYLINYDYSYTHEHYMLYVLVDIN